MIQRFVNLLLFLPQKTFSLFSGLPQRYWSGVLLFFFGVFLFVTTSVFLFHLRVTRQEAIQEFVMQKQTGFAINQSSFEAVSSMLLEKEKRSQAVREAPLRKDPSL